MVNDRVDESAMSIDCAVVERASCPENPDAIGLLARLRELGDAGQGDRPGTLFSCVTLEARAGQNHASRAVREIVNETLALLTGEFSALRSRMGRPSIPRLFHPLADRPTAGCWPIDGRTREPRPEGERRSPEFLDDGAIEIRFGYNNGDEALFRAKAKFLQQPAMVTPDHVVGTYCDQR